MCAGAAPPPAPVSSQAAATPDEALPSSMLARLAAGESAFRVQNYPRTVALLTGMIDHRLLHGRVEQRNVLEWLGVSHYLLGRRDEALVLFTKLAQAWPRYLLDRFLYPPDLIAAFTQRRQDLIDLGVIDPADDPTVTVKLVLVKEVVTRDISPVVNLAPFGIPQFAHGDAEAGTIVAIAQGIGAAATVAAVLAVDGLKGPDGKVAAADANDADALTAIWVAGVALLGGSYIYSVTDGFLSDPVPTETFRYEFIEKERLPDTLPAAPLPNEQTRVHLGPGPTALGLGVNLGF